MSLAVPAVAQSAVPAAVENDSAQSDAVVKPAAPNAPAAAVAKPDAADQKAKSPSAANFAPEQILRRAEALSKKPFERPSISLPAPFDKLSELQYRDIRFRDSQALWRDQSTNYELQAFARGWIFETPVELWVVEDGKAIQLVADQRFFDLGPQFSNVPPQAPYAFSGVSLSREIHQAGRQEPFVAFQGASYFRAVARGQAFGTLARALALNTARQGGEEFPVFRAFWIEKPRTGDESITVHGLLDSASVTGAYRFRISGGRDTTIQTWATLFPRRELPHVGIAPLTSMFFAGPASRPMDDVRERVHNAEGLAIVTGNGERIWRPLSNPKTLQVSAFVDENPKGFGLVQRLREAADYDDLDAKFERRPSVWVTPGTGWGRGAVELVEIPTSNDIHDNIVAYWKPTRPLAAGRRHGFVYTITFSNDVPVVWRGAQVNSTRIGRTPRGAAGIDSDSGENARRFVVDFAGPDVHDIPDLPIADISAGGAEVKNLVVRHHPGTGGVRVSFDLLPGDRDSVELRAALKSSDRVVSESWLYRWTKP